MQRIPGLQFLVLIMLTSCISKTVDHTLVKSGVPTSLLQPGEDWIGHDGYMESKGEYFLRAEKAITDSDFSMQITMEIGSYDGSFRVMAGDNRFGFESNEDEDPAGLFLDGPSFYKSKFFEVDLKDVIPLGTPFNLEVNYSNNLLEYRVDGETIISETVTNGPFGRIRLEGRGEEGSLRIYEWTLDGELVPLNECYSRERLLTRAQKSVDRRAEEVMDDPNRPIFHLQPPANWNNDPNGALFHKGYYHLFYQHNPFDDRWSWMHWGHMRSKDLVHWEHLPIALWPSLEKGEEHCFSGSAIVNLKGDPMLFYTSIGHDAPEQWAAIPKDDELIEWEKHPGNPILTIDDHKGETIVDWRDPQLIHEGDETFMVVGGHPEDLGGSIMLYKALNEELTKWDYLGVALTGEEGNWECPNFFRIGEKWVVIYSPHGPVEYYTGSFDLDEDSFSPEHEGGVDHGSNFYAPNTMEDGKGRRLLWGWIPGFKSGQGWQSAITIPRSLTVSPDGWLIQEPVEELIQLRGAHQVLGEMTLIDEVKKLDLPGQEFEMITTFSNHSAKSYGVRFNKEKAGEVFEISVSGNRINFGDEEISMDPFGRLGDLSFRLFFDRTIVELYVNGGLICATSVVYPDRENPGWEVFAEGGLVRAKSLDIWKMNSIYK